MHAPVDMLSRSSRELQQAPVVNLYSRASLVGMAAPPSPRLQVPSPRRGVFERI